MSKIKLNNLLGFEDFTGKLPVNNQKKTKRTEVGLDVINEKLFSKPDDDIADKLIKDLKDENHGEISGPGIRRHSFDSYSVEIDGKELSADRKAFDEYEVYYDDKKLICSDRKSKKLHDLLSANKKGKRYLRN